MPHFTTPNPRCNFELNKGTLHEAHRAHDELEVMVAEEAILNDYLNTLRPLLYKQRAELNHMKAASRTIVDNECDDNDEAAVAQLAENRKRFQKLHQIWAIGTARLHKAKEDLKILHQRTNMARETVARWDHAVLGEPVYGRA